MTTFTIDSDNNISALAGSPAGADESQSCCNQKELAALAVDWPASLLVDTWNSFAGVAPFDDLKPVKKFTNRSVAVGRIYKAVERLSGSVAQPAADTTQVKATAKKARRTKRHKAGTSATRDSSKKAEVVELMSRKSGAALNEIIKLTGWQAHTVRGFVSVEGRIAPQRRERTLLPDRAVSGEHGRRKEKT
jgi:hypothetical protein